MTENLDIGFNFDNSYLNLPDFFYDKVNLDEVKSPQLVILNEPVAKKLGLNIEKLSSDEGISILAANKKAHDGAYIAEAYAGHQFGYFTMLGDGRAMLIGEQITPSNDRFDLHLKGSGRTVFSRGGDGKAVLGPMLREYIISEAMYGLGIPTTRSLAVVKTGETVYREKKEQGAILTRIATSHIRVGTFEYASHYGGIDMIRSLADYTIDRHYPTVKNDGNKYIAFLQEVVKKQANLIAKWQSVGFIHGVMNTDNMTISGETIDYGPCAFMDTYNPDTVFSSIDAEGRYRYKNQPVMANWNLCRLAETLIPLVDHDKDKALTLVQDVVNNFTNIYRLEYLSIMTKKLGIIDAKAEDIQIVEQLLDIMKKYKEDYTNTFLSLTLGRKGNVGMYTNAEFEQWKQLWSQRLENQNLSQEKVNELMKKHNPIIIPRNHRVEEALKAADVNDYDVIKNLLQAVSNPYDYENIQEHYTTLPKPSSCGYKTYCGT